ncbi:MAG: hypothetical protein ABIP74_04355 [Candidatus Saccharimonas sp.]
MSYQPPAAGATSSTRGLVKLAGDFSGTADSPTVPSLSSKLSTSQRGAANGVASLGASGRGLLAELAPGTVFEVEYDGTNWTYAGATVSARPTSRTDLVMQCVNPINTAVPAWAIAGDRLLRF